MINQIIDYSFWFVFNKSLILFQRHLLFLLSYKCKRKLLALLKRIRMKTIDMMKLKKISTVKKILKPKLNFKSANCNCRKWCRIKVFKCNED